MGQVTSATIKMIRDCIARGEHPPLTLHEVNQLATAWERGQPAASAEPFAVLAVEKNGSVSVFADSTALSERPIDDGDRQWAASRQAQLVEVYAAPVAAQAQSSGNPGELDAQDREDDEALADTQRAIIEAAERRGYERAISECAQVARAAKGADHG